MTERERGPKRNLKYHGGTFEYEGEGLNMLHVTSEGATGKKTVIAPGLAESASNFTDTSKALAERGHDVRVLSPRMKYDPKKIESDMRDMQETTRRFYPTLDQGTFNALWWSLPRAEVAKAFALIAYTEGIVTEGERVNAIGHSQGGANLLIAAFIRPDLFGHVILVNPAGQSGKENVLWFKGMFWKFFSALIQEGSQKGKSHLLTEAAIFLLARRQFARAVGEAYGLATFDAFPLLYALQHAVPPVMRTTVYDDSDPIFRKVDIENAEREATNTIKGGPGAKPFGARHVTQDLGHYHPVTHPEKFAELTDTLLT